MNNHISYSVNCSSPLEIASHLVRLDTDFEPMLSSRVDIHKYTQKLYEKAIRFEAWAGEELVGLVATYCNEQSKGKAFVSSVSVLPEHQRHGVAAQLLRQCIEYVQRQGFCCIELEVDQCSPPAIALYRKFGFKISYTTGTTLYMSMSLGGQIT